MKIFRLRPALLPLALVLAASIGSVTGDKPKIVATKSVLASPASFEIGSKPFRFGKGREDAVHSEGQWDFGEFYPSMPGTKLTLLVHHPDWAIRRIDADSVKIESVIDSTGKPLVQPEKRKPQPVLRRVEGGERITLTVESTEIPASGASSVHLKASAKAVVARKLAEKKFDPMKCDPKLDKEVAVGEIKFRLKGGRKLPAAFYVTISREDGGLDFLRNLQFVTTDGTPIETHKTSSGSSSSGGVIRNEERTLQLATPADEFVLLVTGWTDHVEKRIRIDATFDLSLGSGKKEK